MLKRGFSFIIITGMVMMLCLVYGHLVVHADGGKDGHVYVIPIKENVDANLVQFLKRTTKEAEEQHADHIIFEMDTNGGEVNAAFQIAGLLGDITIPTTTYIKNKALSAGSYIALNTDTIYMNPQAIMGASGVIDQRGNAASKKAQSAWVSAMKGAAIQAGRDPLYAKAMAAASIDLPQYDAKKGEFLTLDAKTAEEIGYSVKTVHNRDDVLTDLGLKQAVITEMSPTFSEKVAKFLTSPMVVPILLTIAFLGFVVEFFSPGFGLPGITGTLAFILFFYGHIVAGMAGYGAVFLLILGICLVIIEFFVPGGIVGLIGFFSIIGSLLMSGEDIGHMAINISIALVISIIVLIILFKFLGFEKGLFRKIILKDQTTSELGYVSSVNRLELIGLDGVAMTPLRPSGSALFNDELLDVVTEGTFVKKDTPITIVKVEGVRIVVRELLIEEE